MARKPSRALLLEAAVQRLVRAHKSLDAIVQCPEVHPELGLQCLLLEHHGLMAGTPHRVKVPDPAFRPTPPLVVEWDA
jgi:hypothetical protein